MSDTQRTAARAKAREILARMKSDPGFIQHLRDDPRATLAAAGMPADVLDEAVDGLGLGPEAEVAGHSIAFSRPSSRGPVMGTIWVEAQEEETGT